MVSKERLLLKEKYKHNILLILKKFRFLSAVQVLFLMEVYYFAEESGKGRGRSEFERDGEAISIEIAADWCGNFSSVVHSRGIVGLS